MRRTAVRKASLRMSNMAGTLASRPDLDQRRKQTTGSWQCQLDLPPSMRRPVPEGDDIARSSGRWGTGAAGSLWRRGEGAAAPVELPRDLEHPPESPGGVNPARPPPGDELRHVYPAVRRLAVVHPRLRPAHAFAQLPLGEPGLLAEPSQQR